MSAWLTRPQARYLLVWICALVALGGLGGGAWLIADSGVGVLGVSNAVPWGWDVVSFVFWIGLGHAGTLISAILLLSRQRWRSSIARYAELMTLCAIVTASVFPMVHVGRIWMVWQMTPLPVASGVWPNMASALLWDALAIGSYFVLSLFFWLIGMWGERASMQALQPLWGRTCMGLALVLTILVVTVHSVVGCDFAVVFRWHALSIPPYFVCGALLSGMAALQLIELCLSRVGLPCREPMARLTLVLSLCMGLFYVAELWNEPTWWQITYAGILLLNVAVPAVYWWGKARQSRLAIAVVSACILIGMWLERVHMIVWRSIRHAGGQYTPSAVDVAMLLGGLGLFAALFLVVSARMPQEQKDPLDAACKSGGECVRRVSLIGAVSGGGMVLLWYALTQWADTAGILFSRPLGYPFLLPPLLVGILLGAGGAMVIFFIHRASRT